MKSEQFSLLIPQYLSGRLSPVEQEAFEARLDASAELRLEVEELRPVWEQLGALPEEQPSAALRARFYQQLNGVIKERQPQVSRRRWWMRGYLPQFATAAAVFVLGMWVGRAGPEKHPQVDQIAQMQTQLQSLREMVALSLLDRQQSATSRLQGVSWSSHVDQPDSELLSALLKALNHDPNVNVRLSSLDALEKYTSDRSVRKELVDSIPLQESPLMQIALIDVLVHIRDNSAAIELRKLAANPELNAAVRQRAKWGIEKLGY